MSLVQQSEVRTQKYTDRDNILVRGLAIRHHFAQFRLTICLAEGDGFRSDMAEGNVWYAKAAYTRVITVPVGRYKGLMSVSDGRDRLFYKVGGSAPKACVFGHLLVSIKFSVLKAFRFDV